VVSFPMGEKRFCSGFSDFKALDQHGLFKELRLLIQCLDLKQSVFRSDHASNYLPLKGELGRDKELLLAQLDRAIHQPNSIALRQEWQRGL